MLISKNSSEVQGFLGFLAKFAVKFRRLVVNWSIGPNKILIRKGFCIYRWFFSQKHRNISSSMLSRTRENLRRAPSPYNNHTTLSKWE